MLDVEVVKQRDPAAIRRLLDRLPDWFGIPESNDEYVAAAATMTSYLARTGTPPDVVGVLLIERHFPDTAEVHLMAVDPTIHRRGVGRQLLDAAEADLLPDGVRLLEVKTLGPSRPHDGYAATREFYRAMGFLPLEERDDIWDPGNPCLIMVKPLA
ncbi:MAG TPA: GNAT family N-acetyltransferase [Mycobacteriales bacterium]|nr:GNAT family N-acetyltransferase [Mycobacteriales bacterium]